MNSVKLDLNEKRYHLNNQKIVGCTAKKCGAFSHHNKPDWSLLVQMISFGCVNISFGQVIIRFYSCVANFFF